ACKAPSLQAGLELQSSSLRAPRFSLTASLTFRSFERRRALLDNPGRELQPRHWMQKHFSSPNSFAPVHPVMGFDQQRISAVHARREGIFRKAAFFFLWILIFVIP